MNSLTDEGNRKARWPVYARHEDARCCNCGSAFPEELLAATKRFPHTVYKGYGRPARYPHGCGEYEAICAKCLMHTFYDLKKIRPLPTPTLPEGAEI